MKNAETKLQVYKKEFTRLNEEIVTKDANVQAFFHMYKNVRKKIACYKNLNACLKNKLKAVEEERDSLKRQKEAAEEERGEWKEKYLAQVETNKVL